MRKKIDSVILKMRGIFDHCFDRAWFFSMLDTVPLGLKDIREIREFIHSDINQYFDAEEIAQRADSLDGFIAVVQDYMLPELKEKLGISYLDPEHMVDDKDELITRRFIAYTLPHNLKELDRLNIEMKRILAQDLEDKMHAASALK